MITTWNEQVTNGQVRWREPTGQAETVKPALGRCWLHVPAVRIQLSSTSEDCGGRSAQILKTHQSVRIAPRNLPRRFEAVRNALSSGGTTLKP